MTRIVTHTPIKTYSGHKRHMSRVCIRKWKGALPRSSSFIFPLLLFAFERKGSFYWNVTEEGGEGGRGRKDDTCFSSKPTQVVWYSGSVFTCIYLVTFVRSVLPVRSVLDLLLCSTSRMCHPLSVMLVWRKKWCYSEQCTQNKVQGRICLLCPFIVFRERKH